MLKYALALLVCLSLHSATTSSITRGGITWDFESPVTYGTYITGDHWVVAPVTITNITPLCITNGAGRTVHGSMINPVGSKASSYVNQGFDSFTDGGFMPYSAALNVARTFPISITTNCSLISCISESPTTATSPEPIIYEYEPLTVVSTEPTSGSFRPPLCGNTKTTWHTNNIRWSVLKTNATVTGQSTAASILSLISSNGSCWPEGWFGVVASQVARGGHNCPPNSIGNGNTEGRYPAYAYGRLGNLMIALHSTESNANKATALYWTLQVGIDIYGACASHKWDGMGGLGIGRKPVLAFTASVLNSADMRAYVDNTTASGTNLFHEDQTTWVVLESDVGRALYHGDGRLRVEYIAGDVGLPEWGEQHFIAPQRDGRNLDTAYRAINYTYPIGQVLASLMTAGVRTNWGHQPYFDYHERIWEVWKAGGLPVTNYDGNNEATFTSFQTNLMATHWDTYYPNGVNEDSGNNARVRSSGTFKLTGKNKL